MVPFYFSTLYGSVKNEFKIFHPGFFEVFRRYQSHLSIDSSEIWYMHRPNTHVKHIKRCLGNFVKF